MPPIRLGVPYFLRTRSLDHFRRDLEDIVSVGATYLVLIMTDFDQLFFRDTLHSMVQEAKGAGLEVQLAALSALPTPSSRCGIPKRVRWRRMAVR